MNDSKSQAPNGEDPPIDPTVLDVRAVIEEIWKLASAEAKRQMAAPLRGMERASDLAQSVVLEFLRQDGTLEFRGNAALKALVKTMVVARMIEKRRHHTAQKRDVRRSAATPSELGDAAPAAADASPVSAVVWRELIARTDVEIAKLSARERRVLELGAKGHTARQIAEVEGISEANAQKLLWRVRQSLGERVFERGG